MIQEIVIVVLGLALLYAVLRDSRQVDELRRQDRVIQRLRGQVLRLRESGARDDDDAA